MPAVDGHDRGTLRRDHVDALVRAPARPRVAERVHERVGSGHRAGHEPARSGDRSAAAPAAPYRRHRRCRPAAGVIGRGAAAARLLGGELVFELCDAGFVLGELGVDRGLLVAELGERLLLFLGRFGELFALPRQLLGLRIDPRGQVGVALRQGRGELQRSAASVDRVGRQDAITCGLPPATTATPHAR